MSNLKSLSISFLLAGGAAAADRPAVVMRPAQPMAPQAGTVRAVASSGFDPFATPSRAEAPRMRDIFDPGAKADAKPGNWTKLTKWMDDRATAVKKAVTKSPEQPEARVGQVPPPSSSPPATPLKRLFDPKPPAPPLPPKVNAANPAYRWYGWGTATPGANPYAPTGDYPLGSAQWYNQTGATPGAFPVPTMNPYRPNPGTEPPVYVAPPAPVATTFVSPVNAVPTIPPRQTIAETPVYNPAMPKAAPAMSLPFAPQQVLQPPTWPSAVTTTEPAWKPASATEPVKKPAEDLIIPVIRGQEPDFEDSPLSRKIRETCRGLVTKITIRETGPLQVEIKFRTSTAALAEIAVKAISDIIELKPYDVKFEAEVRQ